MLSTLVKTGFSSPRSRKGFSVMLKLMRKLPFFPSRLSTPIQCARLQIPVAMTLHSSFLSAGSLQNTLVFSHALNIFTSSPVSSVSIPLHVWRYPLPSFCQAQLKLNLLRNLSPHIPKLENLLHSKHHGARQGGA